MKDVSIRFVFDRKHLATKEKKGIVQMEILYRRVRKFISTGVKLYKDQWNDRKGVVNTLDAARLNDELQRQKTEIEVYITDTFDKQHQAFSWDKLDRWLNNKKVDDSFIRFAERRILERKDIRESTRRTQKKLIKSLEKFGKIVYFSDLTKINVQDYYQWLHGQNLAQASMYSYIRFLKTYVHEAMRMELITTDPFLGLTFKRGEARYDNFLTTEELEKIKNADISAGSIRRVRDLFLVQCYTGLAYSDLMTADFSKAVKRNGRLVLTGRREKSGEPYYIVLIPEVLKVLERYDYVLPKMTNQQYNMRLKLVADAAKIDKALTSHYGRRTCGYLLLNEGVPMEVVSKVLGHSSIKTTESIYAKILNTTVDKAFDRFFEGKGNT